MTVGSAALKNSLSCVVLTVNLFADQIVFPCCAIRDDQEPAMIFINVCRVRDLPCLHLDPISLINL